MLHTYGQQFVSFDDAAVSSQVLCAHVDNIKTLYAVVNTRDRQTTFFIEVCLGAGPHQLWIDQNQRFITLFGYVNHDDTLMHIDLRGR